LVANHPGEHDYGETHGALPGVNLPAELHTVDVVRAEVEQHQVDVALLHPS
jgi:hypothetical protein